MHHFLSKPDWLDDVNEYLGKRGTSLKLDFDKHFVLVENDWLSGREPEDVAATIEAGEHRHVHLSASDIETSSTHG